MPRKRELKLSAERLQQLLADYFPHMQEGRFVVEEAAPMGVTVRMPFDDAHLRPGGTVSGPSLMALADTGMYLAVLAVIGEQPLAVTSSLNINFLRKPRPADVIARTTLLHLGRRLAVGEVHMYCEGDGEAVAQATVSYALPASG
ncbi:MAG TPA: PaaI family thioesterase [Gammaproteobacteria bacterium]|nr:PaaI family thioesterase [Gammaproteobacteria bacterium]